MRRERGKGKGIADLLNYLNFENTFVLTLLEDTSMVIHAIHRFKMSGWSKEGHMTWIIFDSVRGMVENYCPLDEIQPWPTVHLGPTGLGGYPR